MNVFIGLKGTHFLFLLFFVTIGNPLVCSFRLHKDGNLLFMYPLIIVLNMIEMNI